MSGRSFAVNKLVKENLNKWDELAPLKEAQIKSINFLSQSNQYGSIELESQQAFDQSDQSSLSKDNGKFEKIEGVQSSQKNFLHKINEETNELLYNFDISDIEDLRIEKYLNSLSNNSKKCNQISEKIDNGLKFLKELLENYSQVSEKTKSLHVACEQLISDQTKLVNASYLLNSRLSYFTDMDIYIQKLNSPTLETNCEYIIPMLTRIDECMNHFETNITHKESATYLQIVRTVLRKALHFIKTYTVNSLTQTTSSIIQQMQEGSSDPNAAIKFSADNSYTLFYSKFRFNSNKIKTLMEQLEQRVEFNNQPDYEQALSDCHRCYIQQRKSFIMVSVVNAINELVAKNQRDTCTLVRSSCSFMIHLCQDETKLYFNFFSKASVIFEKFLEELCLVLYDRLRPIIIHVVHIETLAELCSILKTEILMDNMKTNAEQLTAFEGVCSQMLEDVQERFVYRTHIYIETEILNYNPSKGDLAYPEKLKIMEEIAQNLRRSSTSSQGEQGTQSVDTSQPQGALSPADAHGMWYPTLRRALVCLSKLYRCLDKKIFEGLAQETLRVCVLSLTKASDLIKKEKTQNDGELFLIKHLLILREQIAPFNNEFSVVEMQLDFTRIKDAAFSFLNKKDKFFRLDRNNAFLDFLLNGTLEAKENLVDSKREVDNQLKKSCETFIDFVCDELFGQIKQLVKQINTVLQINTDKNAPKVVLKQQPFAKPEKFHDIFAENFKHIRKTLPLINTAMSLYLSNKDIEQILLKRIKNNIQQTYMEISQIIAANYNEEDQLIIACPASEQISLWMTVS